LKEKRVFNGVGVSFDVFGDQRVDAKGSLRTETILSNMQKLIDNDVSFGAIAVLAQGTLPYAREIYRFYDTLGIESRLLPYYMTASEEQASGQALGFQQLTSALKSVFDGWLVSDRATPVDPISEYLDYAIAHMAGAPRNTYKKLEDEFVLFVNTDCGVWGLSEAYDINCRYGNVFEEEISSILASRTRKRAAEQAGERMQSHCTQCPYYGHCPGYFVGDATAEQARLLAKGGCPVREVLDHMVGRLDQNGIPEALGKATGRGGDHPARHRIVA
jgi:uncharacterized protein